MPLKEVNCSGIVKFKYISPPPTAKKNRKTLLHWHLKKKTVMFLLKQFTPMSFSTTILTGLLHSNYYNADKMEGNKLL